MKIQLAKPDITQAEIDEVVEVLKSGWLSIGPKIEQFEKSVADYVGVKHAIAVNSGTSALHLLIKAFDIKDEDEVITTPFSFVASTNCILFERAIPVFVDINPETLEMDIDQVESKITSKTKAILAVDVFGHPMNILKLKEIADKYNLILIEDSCEALGSEYDGVKSGSAADAAVFAFYPNKQITTGEGGIVVTNNDYVADICRSLRSQGRAITGFWLHHERMGYNYRMSEMNAALGLVQMQRLPDIISKRSKVAQKYNEKLSRIKEIKIPYVDPSVTVMSWFVYVIRVSDNVNRDGVMDYLSKNGIGCRPYFTPIHVQPFITEMFGYKEEDFPITAAVGRSCIALPFYNELRDEEIDFIVDILEKAVIEYQLII